MEQHKIDGKSPSSRRAWIEIRSGGGCADAGRVALLAEGVDRNAVVRGEVDALDLSPSSRRAQVEIDTKIW